MNDIVKLLSQLRRADIKLELRDGKLKVNAPKGALTDELKQSLSENRDDLLAFLENREAQLKSQENIPVASTEQRAEGIPASDSQARFWFLDRFSPEDPAFNIPAVVEIRGELNLSLFKRSLSLLIERHESLRMAFVEKDGKPYLKINEKPDWELEVREASFENRKQLDDYINFESLEYLSTGFRLDQAPLMRIALHSIQKKYHEEDERPHYLLFACIHHIVCDGWSIDIILRDLTAIYISLLEGTEKADALLPDLDIDFSDYALWAASDQQQSAQQTSIEFWKQKLEGARSLLDFPYDRVRPLQPSSEGASYEFSFDEQQATAVRHFCQELGLTPFMFFMGVYQICLARYTHEKDICVGVPIAGRTRQQLENIVGLFLNALIIRQKVNDEQSLESFFATLRDGILEAYDHQDLAIDNLVDHLDIDREHQEVPGVQFAFLFQNTHDQANFTHLKQYGSDQLGLRPLDLGTRTSKHDICLVMSKVGQGFKAAIEYRSALLDEASVAEFAQHYRNLVDKIVAASQQEYQDTFISGLQLFQQKDLQKQLGIESDVEAIRPLTKSQEGFYLNDLIRADNQSTLIGTSILIEGELDLVRWKQAIEELTVQRAVLRMQLYPGIHKLHEVAYQVIFEHSDVDFELVDGSSWRDEEAQARAREIIYTPFQLQKAPLIRYRLIQLASDRFIFVTSMHHTLMDAVSALQHWVELQKIYQAEPVEADNYLAYLDFAATHIDSESVVTHWQKQLEQVDTPDYSVHGETARNSFHEHGERQLRRLMVSGEKWQAIKAYCRKQRITPAILYKVVFGYLVECFCQTGNNFYINEIITGRPGEFSKTLGNCFLIQPFIFELEDFSAQAQIEQAFEAARSQQKRNRDFAYISQQAFEALQQKGRVAFYYNYLTFMPPDDFPGHTISFRDWGNEIDEAVEFNPRLGPDGLELNLFYREALFRESGFLEILQSLVEQMVKGAHCFADLMLPDRDEHASRLLAEYNIAQSRLDTQVESVVSLFRKHADARPDALAVSSGTQTMTYGQLEQASARVANFVKRSGVNPGERVILALEKSPELMAAILGVLRAGAQYLPLDTSLPEERKQFIKEDSGATLVIENNIGEEFDQQPCSFADYQVELTSPAYTIYTSGSTGVPKGVQVSHGPLVRKYLAWQEAFELKADDRHLQMASTGFDVFTGDWVRALCSGAALFLVDKQTLMAPGTLLDILQQEKITVAEFVPAVLRTVLQECQVRGLRLEPRLLMVGSDAWYESDQALLERCVRENCVLVNSYGVTEAVIDSSYEQVKQQSASHIEQHSVSIGKPLPNTALYILDETQRLLPLEVPGELYIAGPDLADAYVNDEEKTRASFLPDPFSRHESFACQSPDELLRMYRSGDRAKLCQNGELILLGRIGQQVKIRGFRVELGEIENQLNALPEVDECVVLATDRGEHKVLCAYVVFHRNSELDSKLVRSRLAQHLPDYMLPQVVMALEEIPLSANGKLDRRSLPEPDFENLARPEQVPPRNPVEQALLEIWQLVLGIESIGVFDNFFELGGHSLLATQLVSRIKQTFERDIAIKSVFEHPSIAEQGELLEQLLRKSDALQAPEIKPAPRRDLMPVSYAQQRFWFLDQLVPGFFAYNMPFGMTIRGEFDLEAFAQALTEVLRRHESLRSNFVSKDDCVYATISSPEEFPLEHIDLLTEPEDKRSVLLQQLVEENAHKPFKLESDLLIRCTIVKTKAQEHVLLGCMHHIISDGWSVRILFQELAILYNAFSQGRPSPLSEPKLHYVDFAAWEQSWLTGDVLERYTEFWLNELDGAPEILKLPTDKPRPQAQTFNGKQLSRKRPLVFRQSLERFARQQNISLFMLLMAAMAILMSRYTREKDILIGTPVAGREQVDTESMIGLFLNAVIIRSKLEGNPEVRSFLQSVKEHCLSAFAHQDMPAEMLYEHVANHRNPQYPAGAQVGLVLQNTETQQNRLDARQFGEHLKGLSAELLGTEQVVSNYDFGFTVVEQDDGIEVIAEFNTDLFFDSSIEKMLDQYLLLLEQMQQFPERAVDSLELVPQEKLLEELGLDKNVYQDVLPLTAMQESMFLANKFNPLSREYGVGFSVRIEQAIDLELWTESLQGLIDTQDVARVQFAENNIPYLPDAYQLVLKKKQAKVEYFDWSSEDKTEEEIEQFAAQFINAPYNILNDELMRVMLIKVREDYFVGVFGAHHILMDGIAVVAFGVMGAMNYELVNKGAKAIVHEDKYREFLLESQAQTDTAEIQAFWREELLGPERELEALEYPVNSEVLLDPARPPEKLKKSLTLESRHWQAVQMYCKQNRITPALYFKALYAFVLARYCRSENDFYIFEILAGRPAGHMNALGCYFQQIPVVLEKDSFSGEATISGLFKALRQAQKRSKRKQQISVPLQYSLLPEAPVSFMYNFEHYIPDFYFMGKPVRIQEYSNQVNGIVQLLVKTLSDSVQLNLQSQQGFFEDYAMLERIENLSSLIVSGVQKLSELALVNAEEQQALLKTLRGPQLPYSQLTVNELISKTAREYPDNLALKDAQQALSYRELEERSNQLAHYLKDHGVDAGDCVGLCLPLCVDVPVAILAILKTGASYLPMDSQYPDERLKYFIEDARPKLVLSTPLIINTRFNDSAELDRFHNIADPGLKEYPSHSLDISHDANRLLYKLYTSGSTGTPNCTATYHRCEVNLLEWYCNEFSMAEQDRVLVLSALGFDLTQKNFLAPLLRGASIMFYTESNYDDQALLSLIESEHISWLNCAPSAFYPLVDDSSRYSKLDSLRWVFLGGEAINFQRLAHWYQRDGQNCVLVNTYGPSECTDISCFHVLDKNRNYDQVPIGTANNNVELFVLDQHRQLLPKGLPGELFVGGDGVGAGYLNNEALNSERFFDSSFCEGPIYRTGDLVRINNNKQLDYIGRTDFQIKVRGIRIEPGEIEARIRQFKAVQDAVVLLRNDKLLAYVLSPESAEQPELLLEALQSELRRYLSASVMPDSFLVMAQFPLSPNGKVDRTALPDIDRASRTWVAPESETEEKLANIWQDLLGLESSGPQSVSRYDNFFEIGGNSLLAVQLMSSINKYFDTDLPLASLFEAQTLDSLAIKLDSSSSEEWQALVNIKRQGERKLFCIHPVGGEVLCYRDLARSLAGHFSVQAIQSSGLLAGQSILDDADELVSCYADIIASHCERDEPVYLLGQSIGGVFALAIAGNLRKRGYQVSQVIMVDSFVPNQQNLEQISLAHLRSSLGAFINIDEEALAKLDDTEQLRTLFEQARSAYLIPQEIEFEDVNRRFQVIQANINMARSLGSSLPSDIPCLHVEAEHSLSGRSSPDGWRDILQSVDFMRARGDHESIMQAENIKPVAQAMISQVQATE